MKKKFLLIFVLFPVVTLCLIFSLGLLRTYSHVKGAKELLTYQTREMLPKTGYQFYASLPEVLGTFTTAIAVGDARPEIIRQFLHLHTSPLEAHTEAIISASDQNNIDFRLITAIAMCESNLGKKMPVGSFNAWGFAIYTGEDSGAAFDNWNEAINIMARYLSSKFYSQGLTTPEQIGPIYAPPSINTENSWSKCVRTFMDELT